MCLLILFVLFNAVFSLRMVSNALPYKSKVAVIGSGNWGTAVARRIAMNIKKNDLLENKQVKMWVFEEEVNNRLLSDIINHDHANPKYLPNVELPENVVACTDLVETCADADVLLFVVPHQFLPGVLNSLKGNVKSTAIGVSLIKGIQFSAEGPILLTELVKNELGLLSTAAVMGANVASDVASDAFVEATVGAIDINVAKTVAALFESPTFQTEVCTDQSTVELCGALKNIIAIGAGKTNFANRLTGVQLLASFWFSGFCDGMQLGVSSKAALIRQGTKETALFCKLFDRTGNHKVCLSVLFHIFLSHCVSDGDYVVVVRRRGHNRHLLRGTQP
jgi:glycerol-3-phosphate dehydrogenase (NAD+)